MVFRGLFLQGHGDVRVLNSVADKLNMLMAAVFLVAYHVLELPSYRKLRDRFFLLPSPVRGIAYGVAIVYLLLYVPVGSGAFIYANF